MGYCPKCGSKFYSDEVFCVNCGEKLPDNIEDRLFIKKWQLKYFLVPFILFFLMASSALGIFAYNRIQMNKAKKLYEAAEESLLLSDYQLANEQVKEAIEIYPTFSEARDLYQFTTFSLETLNDLSKKESNQDKLQLILKAKNELTQYSGEIASQFQNHLLCEQNSLQISMVKNRLENEPTIDDLPALLWEADSINDPEAYDLVRTIREMLITESTNQAYQYIDQNQFSLAENIIESTLYYLPNDEKLTSLLNSITKEKIAFEEAAEARLEQAFSQFEAEQEMNESDAVEDALIEFEINDRNHLNISGEIKSVATIPIHAILVHYSIIDKNDTELETNEVYVYPDTLYPGETGEFDHTHTDFDKQLIEEVSDVHITSITWLLD